jgi:microcystin degradation protein MlrC
MPKTMKILIGEVNQESNTFCPVLTTMDEARRTRFCIGNEVIEKSSDTIRGFLSVAKAAGAECFPSLAVKIQSLGAFKSSDYEVLKTHFLTQVREAIRQAGKIDGVLFAMHGAMVAESCDDVEGDLTGLIRAELGEDVPIVITLDPHANVTQRMVRNVNGMFAYKTYPHIDLFESSTAAANLLISILKDGLSPAMVMRKLPMIVPAENSQSIRGPFAALLAEAEAGVRRGDAIATSLFPTQPWLDIDEMGFSVTVLAANKQQAEREAERLAGLIWARRHEFDVELHQVKDVVDFALREKGVAGPVVASNSSDSPGAGSSGDSNFVLKNLLELKVEDKLACFLDIIDAPAVAKAIEAGVGEIVELQVGHSLDRTHGEPISIRGRVTHIGDGTFRLDSLDRDVTMGRAVIVKIGRILLLLHEHSVPCIDPRMFRSMGIDPAEADLVVVRSATQFRDGYEPMARAIFILDAPGFSPANLKSLSFLRIKRPFFPFDDNFDPV